MSVVKKLPLAYEERVYCTGLSMPNRANTFIYQASGLIQHNNVSLTEQHGQQTRLYSFHDGRLYEMGDCF